MEGHPSRASRTSIPGILIRFFPSLKAALTASAAEAIHKVIG
jgi:hypothetical protein